jgi:peptidoglycan/LPS O-acetylase OafA/YrhL
LPDSHKPASTKAGAVQFKQERLLWLMLAGTLAIAAFSWHFFEKPFIRRSHRG